jgi:ADP-ribose pyrophosphatase YjhB (NUDIX family)
MWRNLLAAIWRRAPRRVRRWTTRLTQSRFAVTAAAIILNADGEVLLLKHTFRPGTGWGLPGGFLQAGEQPEAALRRELLEEVGLELGECKLYKVRVFKKPSQMEIVFLCYAMGEPRPQSIEIRRHGWFTCNDLPDGLPADQHQLILKAVPKS